MLLFIGNENCLPQPFSSHTIPIVRKAGNSNLYFLFCQISFLSRLSVSVIISCSVTIVEVLKE